MTMTTLSVSGDLHPDATISSGPILVVALSACLALALLLALLALAAHRLKRRPRTAVRQGAHSGANAKGPWHTRVDAIIAQYEEGTLERDAAFTALAKVARDYASHISGKDMSSHTLADISRTPRNPGNRHGLDLLKQTIAALYPPEFADAAWNAAAQDASVEQAGEWVLRLVERWRR